MEPKSPNQLKTAWGVYLLNLKQNQMRLIYTYFRIFDYKRCLSEFSAWPPEETPAGLANPLTASWPVRLEDSFDNEFYALCVKNLIVRSLNWLVNFLENPISAYNALLNAPTAIQTNPQNEIKGLNSLYKAYTEPSESKKIFFNEVTLGEYYENIKDPAFIVSELVDLVYLIRIPVIVIACLGYLHYFEHYRVFTNTSGRWIFRNCMWTFLVKLALIPISYVYPRGYCYDSLSFIVLKVATNVGIAWVCFGFPLLFIYHCVKIHKNLKLAKTIPPHKNPESFLKLQLREEGWNNPSTILPKVYNDVSKANLGAGNNANLVKKKWWRIKN